MENLLFLDVPILKHIRVPKLFPFMKVVEKCGLIPFHLKGNYLKITCCKANNADHDKQSHMVVYIHLGMCPDI